MEEDMHQSRQHCIHICNIAIQQLRSRPYHLYRCQHDMYPVGGIALYTFVCLKSVIWNAVLTLPAAFMPLLRLHVNTYRVLIVMPCIVLKQPRLLGLSALLTISLLGLSALLTISGVNLLGSVDDTVNYLSLWKSCNAFYSSGLVLTIYVLSLVNCAALQWLPEYARTVVALLMLINHTWSMNAQFFSHLKATISGCSLYIKH